MIPNPAGLACALACALPWTLSCAHASDEGSWPPQTHGFVGLGAIDTTGNNWLGDTEGGSVEFWEAGLNAAVQASPHVRFAGQVFVRDFLRYDNGRPQFDWGFLEWRPRDWAEIRLGRVKVPLGLMNEQLDIDAARVPVFSPVSIYALRSRDLFLATDGGRIDGFLRGALGGLGWAIAGGRTALAEDGGLARFFTDLGVADRIDALRMEAMVSGRIDWWTPFEGLRSSVSYTQMRGFRLHGALAGFASSAHVERYHFLVGSLQWEHPDVILTGEVARAHAELTLDIDAPPAPISTTLDDDTMGLVLSAIWHLRRDLDLYTAYEQLWSSALDLRHGSSARWIAALRWDLTPSWSLKGEFHQVRGSAEALAQDNPDDLDRSWQIFALKTTVDF